MIKLFDIDSSFFNEEPVVTILDLGSAEKMVKSAADARINTFVSDLKPEIGKIYVHILAMGAGEYYGANRNADFFPEENLIKCHDTFRTSPAHIFKHHVNKNPDIAIGKVIFSIYNERMHRVEIIAWIDTNKGWDVVEKIERGEFPATSMACHTPFDTCSICHNKARSRNEYCSHLRGELGKIHHNGEKTMAINDGPLKFFDMSVVFKPADVTSSVLQKVAYSKQADAPVGSAEAAEMIGLLDKASAVNKISSLIKEIEGTVVGSADSLKSILSRIKDPDEEVIGLLERFELDHVIHALAELGVSPSVGFFAKLIGRKICGEDVSGIETLVQGLIQEDPDKVLVPEMSMHKLASEYDLEELRKILFPQTARASLFPEPVLNRELFDTRDYAGMILSNTHNVGYIGNPPTGVSNPRAQYLTLRDVYKEQTSDGSSMLKTLFTIGGAAIAAKWLISKLIESKMQEIRSQANHKDASHTKIVLVKSAQQAFTAQQLAKACLLHSLKTGL
jgi:hypothetical protein